MSIALPVTKPGVTPHNDPRHYTPWKQIVAPQIITASPLNPVPEDPGTVTPHGNEHYTAWVPK